MIVSLVALSDVEGPFFLTSTLIPRNPQILEVSLFPFLDVGDSFC